MSESQKGTERQEEKTLLYIWWEEMGLEHHQALTSVVVFKEIGPTVFPPVLLEK